MYTKGRNMNNLNCTRRNFLKAIGFSAASLAVPGCTADTKLSSPETPRRKPNVILVITDDQGYGDLACHGNPIIKTPNLDLLHSQSTCLTNFHVSPTCAPTRAALMTGRYCNRTGVWHTIMGRSLLRKDETTMADVFSANGYKTAIFGKWHLGDNYPFRPADRGFGESLVHGGGGVGQAPDYWDNDYFDDTYFHNGKPKKFKGYCTDIWFDAAIKFIEKNKEKPFFCYLSTNAPHGPYNVEKKYSDLYKDNENVPNANFYGMITNIDENIGRLMKRLKNLKLENDTIFIFMTDNGTSAGFRQGKGCNAGMRARKGSEYDGGHRVPCFIRWPNSSLKSGSDIDRLSAHIDLLPTLLEMCRLKKPAGPRFDGASLMPLLTAPAPNWPDRTIITDSQRIEHPQKWRKSAVMTDRWRLVNGKELYDIKTDPGQKNNLEHEHPQVVKKLRTDYEKWWQSVSSRFDEYCEIILGCEKENPLRLSSHDWHGTKSPPWHQNHIRNAKEENGFWAVEIARDGKYEFELRRWPREMTEPITPTPQEIPITRARLKIGNVDLTQSIAQNALSAKFSVRLKAQKTTLQTWLIDENSTSRGAYYVYVTYVP